MNELWSFTWVAGPDAGGTTVLAHGTHIIGRAPGAAVQCDDPALEPHHLLAEITPDGARAAPTHRARSGSRRRRAVGDSVMIVAAARLEIGHSMLTVCRRDLTAPGHEPDPANITVTSVGSVRRARPAGGDRLGTRCVDAAEATCGPQATPAVACFPRSWRWPAPA